MSAKRPIIAALAITLCILGASAAAQEQRNEFTGTVGRIFISDQGIHGSDAPTINPFVRSGKGLTFELNYSRRLFGNAIYAISGEIPAAFNLDEDLNSGGPVVPVDYRQIFITPAFRVNLFPETAVSPRSVSAAASPISAKTKISPTTAPTPAALRIRVSCKLV